jgi:hypothetical protein
MYLKTHPILAPRLRVSLRFLKYVFLVLFLCVSLLPGVQAHAVSSDFIVRTFVGDDTTPPTVPTGLTTTPVATTQINLSWLSSTDDYLLAGYQVFRDGLQIATTTGTTYSDVGLTASTTYTYNLTAFDSFNNFSASSTLVATTTFATATVPVVATTTTPRSQTGTRIRLAELVSLEVIPSQYGAIIRYETDSFVRSNVRWGTSLSYELGSSRERSFSRFHEVLVSDLTPGTRYRFTIEGENHMGRFGTLTESTFVTLPQDDTTPPGNVIGLTLRREGNDVVLSWQNPRDTDLSRVRVLRSTTFFPGDEIDGWVVFDGEGTSARDVGIIRESSKIFYTVFTYDAVGNISSGAVVALRIEGDAVIPEVIDNPNENSIDLTFDDIQFYQDGGELTRTGGTVLIDGALHLTLAIPYDTLPEHLKAILVTITPATDPKKELSFLLRVNKEKTAYTARLAPLGVTGDFGIRVSVFDFKTSQIGYTSGQLRAHIERYEDGQGGGGEGSTFFSILTHFLMRNYLILFALLLILLAFLARKLLQRRS